MSEMLTDTELSEIRARAEAATPGPWRFGSQWDDDVEQDKAAICVWTNEDEGAVADVPSNSLKKGDLNFIIHARTDIPALLAHIDEQREEIEHLKRALEWIAQSDCRGEGNSTFCWRWCPCWSNKDRSGHCTGTIIEASMKATEEASGE